MTPLLTVALLVGAVCTLVLVLRKIRHAEVTIADSTFWFLFAISLVLLAVLPGIAFFFAGIFGIESPANFVFVYVIAVLVIREFYTTVELSQLRAKVRLLVQNEALADAAERGGAAGGEGAGAPGRNAR